MHNLKFHSPMPYFNLRPGFITVLLHNKLARLQLFVIILNCVGILNRPQYAQVVNAVLFNMKLIVLPLWSRYKVVCHFHASSNCWLNLSETFNQRYWFLQFSTFMVVICI